MRGVALTDVELARHFPFDVLDPAGLGEELMTRQPRALAHNFALPARLARALLENRSLRGRDVCVVARHAPLSGALREWLIEHEERGVVRSWFVAREDLAMSDAEVRRFAWRTARGKNEVTHLDDAASGLLTRLSGVGAEVGPWVGELVVMTQPDTLLAYLAHSPDGFFGDAVTLVRRALNVPRALSPSGLGHLRALCARDDDVLRFVVHEARRAARAAAATNPLLSGPDLQRTLSGVDDPITDQGWFTRARPVLAGLLGRTDLNPGVSDAIFARAARHFGMASIDELAVLVGEEKRAPRHAMACASERDLAGAVTAVSRCVGRAGLAWARSPWEDADAARVRDVALAVGDEPETWRVALALLGTWDGDAQGLAETARAMAHGTGEVVPS